MAHPSGHHIDPAYDGSDEPLDALGGWVNEAIAELDSLDWPSNLDPDCLDIDPDQVPSTQTVPELEIDALIRESTINSQLSSWPSSNDYSLFSSQDSNQVYEQCNTSVSSDICSDAAYSAGAWSNTSTPWLYQTHNPGFPRQDGCHLAVEHIPQSALSQTSRTESRRSSSTPYRCDKAGCKAAFDAPSRLRHHQRCHTLYEHRPHVCDECQKRFVYAKDLIRHKVTHDKTPGSFICPQEGCAMVFKRSDHLTRHIAKSHQSKPEAASNTGRDHTILASASKTSAR